MSVVCGLLPIGGGALCSKVSWLVVVIAILLGMAVIAVSGGTSTGVRPPVAVFVAIAAGCGPILASLIAPHDPRRAARIDLWIAPFTPFFTLLFQWEFGGCLKAGAVFFGAIVTPGFFWLLTSRRNWPQLLQSQSPRWSPSVVFRVSGFFCLLAALGAFSSLFVPWWSPIGDCFGRPLYTEQGVPQNIDFTAKIVFVGPATYHGRSLWSVARVEQSFSGVPSWAAHFVFLRGYFPSTDRLERYFIEGVRSTGAITRFLPVIEPVPCGRTARIGDAVVALRVMQDGPPRSGVRIVGRVFDGLTIRKPVPGVGVLVAGPSGERVLTTDQLGIFDVIGLPPGEYTVKIAGQNRHGVYAPHLEGGAAYDSVFYLN